MARVKINKDADSPVRNRKIAPEDVSAGIRPDELGRILNLKKDLDYSDVLSKYASRYLQMGWELVAVNPKGAVNMDLDFRQPQEVWSKRLADLGMEGVQVNLGVRTGSASNLLVLEVRPGEGELPFENWDDWRSGCIAEVGGGWEQHYYILPQGWPLPSSCFVDPHRLMVFGSGGLVLAPPSVEPRVQESLRWLRPPWENPPSRPSTRLWQFLQENVPIAADSAAEEEPAPPEWAEIYGTISQHPGVLRVLLAPKGSAEEYYLQVLQTALKAGLTDPQLLLGLLWHAPLGDARTRPQGRQELCSLINATQKEQAKAALDRVETLIQELQGAFAHLSGGGSQAPGAEAPQTPPPKQAASATTTFSRFKPPVVQPKPEPGPEPNFTMPGQGMGQFSREVFEQPTARVLWRPRESILVERDRYEAMVYELGKLGAFHEIQKHYFRENRLLKERIDTQQQKEISRLRRLCTQQQKQKKDKGWWR